MESAVESERRWTAGGGGGGGGRRRTCTLLSIAWPWAAGSVRRRSAHHARGTTDGVHRAAPGMAPPRPAAIGARPGEDRAEGGVVRHGRGQQQVPAARALQSLRRRPCIFCMENR
jgi:hypothetical protein